MNRYLFAFGYKSPTEGFSNQQHGSDFESSEAVWVRATSEEDAMSKGRAYAKYFFAKVYREEKLKEGSSWSEANFAHWISKKPVDEFPESDLNALDEI